MGNALRNFVPNSGLRKSGHSVFTIIVVVTDNTWQRWMWPGVVNSQSKTISSVYSTMGNWACCNPWRGCAV